MKSPQVFGKYLLLERISVGGMAEIFIAKAFGVEGFERILAIKKILPTMAEDAEFITMFIDEARISSQLNHANVVHIHELGKFDDNYYIAMEYVQGLDLRAIAELYRRERQTMPVPMAAYIVSKICEGLDYAHRAKDGRGKDLNIVHRDVSPQNVLVSFDGDVKIIDFGIAKAANRSQQTQVGILKGKFGYMSPEQAMGKPIDRRSDLFAVGVILYELLTGDRLFVGESDFSVVEKVRTADIVSPREMNPEIPKALEKVILKTLARDQHDRYQWCSELQEDLNKFLLTDGGIYSGKYLSAFMKEAFAEDLQREGERLEKYSKLQRPPDLEDSNVSISPRRRTSQQLPAVGAQARLPPAATPSRGVPPAASPSRAVAAASSAPPRRAPDAGAARAGAREPARSASAEQQISRRMTPAPRRAPTPPPQQLEEFEEEGAPPPDRTQIVDASHLQDKPQPDTGVRALAEQSTNVKERPGKGKVVIGEKAVHGPTVIGAAPESRPERPRRNGAPPIDAPPSVVVDAGLGLDEPGSRDLAPDTGVHDLPEDTGSYPQPPELADDEPRTQGVDSYSFGDELPEEHTPASAASAASGEDEDDAPPPWPSLEGRGETYVGSMPVDESDPDAAERTGADHTGRHANPAGDVEGPPSVIVGGDHEPLGASDERTPADEVPGRSHSDSISVDPSLTERPSLGEGDRAPTATAAIAAPAFTERMSASTEAAPALGDAEVPPSTGSATMLEVQGQRPAMSAGDELDALMGGNDTGSPDAFERDQRPGEEAPPDEDGLGFPPQERTGESPRPSGFEDETALGAGEQERTGEVPQLSAEDSGRSDDAEESTSAAEPPSETEEGVPEGYTGMDRTAAIPAPSELQDEPQDDEGSDADRTAAIEPPADLDATGGYAGIDRTGSIPAPSGVQDEETGGYAGHDRTAATSAPSELQDDSSEGYAGHDRTAAVPAPSELRDEDTGTRPVPVPDEEDAADQDEELAASAEDGDEHRYAEEERDAGEDELTRPERARRPAAATRAPMAQKTKLIALAGAGGAVAVIALVLALTLGGDPTGALLVRVEPATAQLMIDGRPIQNGQVVTGLEAGEHEVVASAAGYKTQRQKLRTTQAQTTAQIVLEPEAAAPPSPSSAGGQPETAAQVPAGEATAEPQPAAAESAAVAATPPSTEAVEQRPEGDKSSETAAVEPPEAAAEAKEPTDREEDAKPAETRVASSTPRAVEAKPAPRRRANGQLACTSSPQGAEVFIDGKSTNRVTPVPFGSAISLPAGTHTLMLKLGKLKHVRKIQITEGEMTTVRNAPLQ